MYKFIVFCISIFILPLQIVAQQDELSKKGLFYINLGPEYRITPVYSIQNSSLSDESAYTNVDKQNAGLAINLGIEYFIGNNFSIGFSNSFRYDLVISEFTDNPDFSVINKADYKILFDYHFFLSYYFKVFKKGDIFVTAGTSLMNRNTDFSVKQVTEDGNGIGFFLSDYHYSANKLSIGYANNGKEFFIGTYIAKQTPYFNENVLFFLPHVGITFDISKF